MHLRHPFEERIVAVRKQIKPEPFDWYSFDSFGNLTNIDAFLPGGMGRVAELAGEEPVADIGTGDGDLAFLLESLGCKVTALDWPGTNMNRMLGVNLMKRELGSAIEIREVDIDDQFRLDGERFGVAVALGLLYHLKNPFYFLERLATHSRYCLMSTRILPGRKEAIAYLTADREFDNDTTNYWFLSQPGVLRLLDRCGWDVVRSHVTGAKKDRFYWLAESRVAKTRQTLRLLDGWNRIENDAWRWTKREFAFVVDNTDGATQFELRFLMNRTAKLSLQATVNGLPLEARVFEGPGRFAYSESVAGAAQQRVRVLLNDAVEIEGRELGVVVTLPSNTIVDEESGIRFLPQLPNHGC